MIEKKVMTGRQYAKHRGADEKQVRRWIADGLPHERPGYRYRIDPKVADRWVERNAQPREDQSPERQRLIHEQADKVALGNAVQRGELLRLDHITDVMTAAISNLTSQLDSIAGRLANELAAEENPAVIKQAILNEHNRIQTAFADQLEKVYQRPAKPKATPRQKRK